MMVENWLSSFMLEVLSVHLCLPVTLRNEVCYFGTLFLDKREKLYKIQIWLGWRSIYKNIKLHRRLRKVIMQ
jgi:hypothetical protein